MIPSPDLFEKLSAFYLGRTYDLQNRELLDDLLMYDAKDLCTHAMCVGMTGSGKTGLCLSLLEEAAIDGVPAICVDPKGDLANLLLAFPDLAPEDFRPWIQPGEASRKGKTVDQMATDTAQMWRDGLASWGQSPDRIATFRDSVDVNIYTPGSNIGLPVTVLKSFDAPPPDVIDDTEAMASRVTGATSGLLTLMGVDADPLLSPEHILISSILDHRWREGHNVSIGSLIGLISSPPMQRIGVLDLETFMPSSERSKLAMRLNNLLASPAFSTWLDGDALSIPKLLHTPEGKPRLSILSIAHLSDRERMFFVTILLNELVSWMRTQQGTSSLRAMFYMDEVAGYFPPVANPPSKPPMLTLLKQARAFGLGVTLATQNPVDLDYKGLSNIGTWFLGRLQTERDKARVIDGLEGAAVQTGATFDRAEIERMLSALGNRVFLMNNVHEDAPVVFQTRWAMSYLAGPLARDQISRLMKPKRAAADASNASDAAAGSTNAAGSTKAAAVPKPDPVAARPVVPPGVGEQFLASEVPIASGGGPKLRMIYRPALYAEGSLHYIRSGADLDQWRDIALLVDCGRGVPDDPWEHAEVVHGNLVRLDQPEEGFAFAELPNGLMGKTKFRTYQKELKDALYRHHGMTLYQSPLVDGYAPPPQPGEPMDPQTTRQTATLHFRQLAREELDRRTEKLRAKYAKRMASLDRKIQTAQRRVDREQSQYKAAKMSAMARIAGDLLGAFMGRKLASRSNVSRVSTAARSGARAMREKDDIDRAEETLEQLAIEQTELNDRLQEEIQTLTDKYAVTDPPLEEINVAPRKSDLKTEPPIILWTPWTIDAHGIATRAWQ